MTKRAVKGFSLVEAMIALFILLLCLIGIFSGLVLSYSQAQETRQEILAHLLAESVIEDVLAHPWGTTTPPPGWKKDGKDWTRTESLGTIIEGRDFDNIFKCRIGDDSAGALVTVGWTEEGRAEKLQFVVPRESGWRTEPSFNKPAAVSENWSSPGSFQYPSEPSNDHGNVRDQSVTFDDPKPSDAISPEMVALANKLTSLRSQKDKVDQEIADKQAQIDNLQKQIDAASKDDKPALEAKKKAAEGDKTDLQNQSDALQKKIDSVKSQISAAS